MSLCKRRVPRAVILRRELAEDIVAVTVHCGGVRPEDPVPFAPLAHKLAELFKDVLEADGGVTRDSFGFRVRARTRAVAAVCAGGARAAERVGVVDADVARRVWWARGAAIIRIAALDEGEMEMEGRGGDREWRS